MKSCKEHQSCSDLIDSLCDELKVCCVLKHPVRRFVPFFLFVMVYLTSSIFVLGLRPDVFEKMLEVHFLFEILLVFFMALFSGIASVWLCVPDMRHQNWMNSVSLTLFAVFAVWTGLRTLMESYVVPHPHWHSCYTVSIVFGAIPAVLIFLLSMKGRTTHPVLLSAMNALAIGGAGYIGLRLICRADDMGHICVFHLVPYILFAFIAGIVGRKIYRW